MEPIVFRSENPHSPQVYCIDSTSIGIFIACHDTGIHFVNKILAISRERVLKFLSLVAVLGVGFYQGSVAFVDGASITFTLKDCFRFYRRHTLQILNVTKWPFGAIRFIF